MAQYNLKRIFNPRQVAVVGASEKAGTIGDADGRTGEFAVLVGDAWQGKGIGGNLLKKCLSIAEKQGFKTVHGIVLQENRNMLALGKKLGFEAKRDLDAGDNRLVIHFGGGARFATNTGKCHKNG